MNSRARVVRLYHGTSVAAARRIVAEGFSPPDPILTVAPVASRYGVPNEVWQDPLLRYAQQRSAWRDVSFSTGWGDAASYARRAGGEAVWYALCAIGRHLHDVDFDSAEVLAWVGEQPTPAPAVITIEASLIDVLSRVPPGVTARREDLLPAEPGSIRDLFDVADEVVLTAPVPIDWIVRVEELGACTCDGTLRRRDRCHICPHRVG